MAQHQAWKDEKIRMAPTPEMMSTSDADFTRGPEEFAVVMDRFLAASLTALEGLEAPLSRESEEE